MAVRRSELQRCLASPLASHVIPAEAGIQFVRKVDPGLSAGDEKDSHLLGRAAGP